MRTRLTGGHRRKYWHRLRQELMRRRDEGKVSEEEYGQAFDAMENPRTAQRVILRSQDELGEIDWDGIVQWIKDHWLDILKIILTICLLFLEPKPGTEDEEDPLWPEA